MREAELKRARDLAEARELDAAWNICERYLRDDPNDPLALIVGSFAMQKADKLPVAYHLSRRLTEVTPAEASAWINFGMVAGEMLRFGEAERAYRKGLEVAKDAGSQSMLLVNLGALMIDQGRFVDGERYIERALKLTPDSAKARANLGFCQLAQRNWKEGWANYHACLGTDFRKRQCYSAQGSEEPEWDGSPGKTVIVYGEQGIGDEICFASMIPDAIERAGRIIMDVDPRLAGLFRRSFPKATVHGTRTTTCLDWPAKDREFHASLAIGQLGEFFRQQDEDFPSSPYLVADPDRVTMWKALWAKKGKPVIGIAWRGGIFRTGAKFRNLDLEQLLPVFQAVDAHWVCLQYRDAAKEIAAFREKHPDIDLVQYPHATLTNDYDDTAGLVASLDGVVSVPTAVVHLAGALGTPCIAMKSPASCWKFKANLPMHPMVRLIENDGSWLKTIAKTADAVRAFNRVRAAA